MVRAPKGLRQAVSGETSDRRSDHPRDVKNSLHSVSATGQLVRRFLRIHRAIACPIFRRDGLALAAGKLKTTDSS
jgi:hypothetical protein